MLDPPPPRTTRLVAEDLGTGAIPGDLSAILVSRFRTVFRYGLSLPSDKRSGLGVHYFLMQIALGVDHIPGL